jgi:nucleoside-diphosphate-sugar epimerase
VVHLAAEPNDQDFPLLVGPNVMGLFNVMDAARQEGVRRVVLASSIQVLSRREERQKPARVDEAHPGNHYALTKLWAEEMGAMYARRYGMSVIAARIAWMVRDVKEARMMQQRQFYGLYLSGRDAGRFFAQAVEAESIEFAVLFAVSADGQGWFEMEPARTLIGYEPQDHWPEGLCFDLPKQEVE